MLFAREWVLSPDMGGELKRGFAPFLTFPRKTGTGTRIEPVALLIGDLLSVDTRKSVA